MRIVINIKFCCCYLNELQMSNKKKSDKIFMSWFQKQQQLRRRRKHKKKLVLLNNHRNANTKWHRFRLGYKQLSLNFCCCLLFVYIFCDIFIYMRL